MRGRLVIAISALVLGAVAVAALVVLVDNTVTQSDCRAEADRVAAAMANPDGPMPSLSALTKGDASTVREVRNAFTQAYESNQTNSQTQKTLLENWDTLAIPELKTATLASGGC